ncbi:MAG: Fe-S cluster assembly protein SufB, partial [archaeon]
MKNAGTKQTLDRSKERALAQVDYSKYDFNYGTKNYETIFAKGLNEETVRKISEIKKEPNWMLDFRLKALKAFMEMPMPKWGANLGEINFDEIIYYMKASQENMKSWDDVPKEVKETFERLGIPEAERKFLAGVEAQYDSEVMYSSIREDLQKKGVIFMSMDQGLKEHEDIVKQYFGKIIPYNDNKFAALNSAVWSGGSFVFVPKNVKVEIPLQAYFRINAESFGQFERTLIIGDEGS